MFIITGYKNMLNTCTCLEIAKKIFEVNLLQNNLLIDLKIKTIVLTREVIMTKYEPNNQICRMLHTLSQDLNM